MKTKMTRILVILGSVLVLSIAIFSLGVGYVGGIRGIGLLGVCFFLTFGITVVLAQMIPAGILIASLLGASWPPLRKTEVSVRAA